VFDLDINTRTPDGRYLPSEMSNDQYHKLEGISASGIKKALSEPQLYLKKHLLQRLPSPALDIGTALHEAVLEEDKFHISKYDLKPAEEDRLKVMINNTKVMFDYILKDTANEHSFIFYDEVIGQTRKVRVDAYDETNGILYDVKSTRYSDPQAFARDAYRLGYHVQGAFYIDTMRALGYKANHFAFLVCPSENPFEPFAFEMTEDLIEDGRAIYSELIANILEIQGRNDHRIRFKPLDLPQWRREQLGLA